MRAINIRNININSRNRINRSFLGSIQQCPPLVIVVMAVFGFVVLMLSPLFISSSLQSMKIVTTSNNNNKNIDEIITDKRKLLYKYAGPSLTNTPKSTAPHCGVEPGYTEYFELSDEHRSSSNEDNIIYETFFKDYNPKANMNNRGNNPFYLEIGAFNGLKESNTRFFDDCLLWNGILIEANPKMYTYLLENRPTAHKLSFASSCNITEERNNKTIGFWESWWTNSAQDDKPNSKDYSTNIKKEDQSGGSRYVQVPCGSLTPVILGLIPSRRIHFFSLDVEGAEYDVIKTIDFSKITIDVIIAENENAYCGKICPSRDAVQSLLQQNSYILHKTLVPRSDVFVHQSSEYAPKLQALLQSQ